MKKETGGARHDRGRKSWRVRLSRCDGVGSMTDLVISAGREVSSSFIEACSVSREESSEVAVEAFPAKCLLEKRDGAIRAREQEEEKSVDGFMSLDANILVGVNFHMESSIALIEAGFAQSFSSAEAVSSG